VRTRLLAAVVVAVVGAGGEAAAADLPQRSIEPCVPGSVASMRTMRLAYSATARVPLHVRRELTAHSGMRFELRNANGVATVFGVLAARVDRSCRPTDYKVQLPIRPNGSMGWVRAADVDVRSVRTRIRVDLSKRRISLFRDGRAILVTTAAVGASSTPTPTGHFYVNQRLLTRSPFGDYGPGAIGISAFSEVLPNWPQGGPIAIHGTDAPGLIGFAISHGCLRVRNVDDRRLLRLAVEGTPVEIRR